MQFRIGPVIVSESINVKEVVLDNNAILLLGSTTIEQCAYIFLDNVIRVTPPMSKEMMERLHLERIRFDHLSRTGALLFDQVERGPDPPDFKVSVSGQQTGVDVSVLGIAERRNAYSLFESFCEHLLKSAPQLSNLRDTHVGVWFDLCRGLPPRRTDVDIVNGLITLLRDTNFDRADIEKVYQEIAKSGMPSTFPPNYPIRHLEGKEAGFAISVLSPSTHSSDFRNKTGFECSLQMSVLISVSSVMGEISRLVKKHDKEGVDWLALIVGGPDAKGLAYPGECAMFPLIASSQTPIVAQYIRRVTVHHWQTGSSLELMVQKVS